jgi:hypothetical protein
VNNIALVASLQSLKPMPAKELLAFALRDTGSFFNQE